MMLADHPAYKYAYDAAGGSAEAPKYVRKQAVKWLHIADGNHDKYRVNEKLVTAIGNLLTLMVMPKGPSAGKRIGVCLTGFQWFLLIAVLCTVHRDNPHKRKYQSVLLEIARKNAKTFLVAVFYILLFFLEPRFSKFYSVAPDGKLSREVRDAIKEIIKSSPAIGGPAPGRFRLMRDQIICKDNDNEYIPLNYSTDRLDGKQPSVFLVDEAGALPNSYAIEAMRSGQILLQSKLGCVISTKYPSIDNPLESEVAYAKRVLEDIEEDEELFALLYEPDETTAWMTDDLILKHANPLAIDVPTLWESLLQKRQRAIVMESARQNFLCKHCNIFYQGAATESLVSIDDLRRGRVPRIDWRGRRVWLGLDLAMTEDNCAVGMVADDGESGVLAKAVAFIPEDRIEEKTAAERVDYRAHIARGDCFACGDRIVSYAFIEEYIMGIEKAFGVHVLGFGYDRWNAVSSAQKLEQEGMEGTIIEQSSRVLHPTCKWMCELVVQGKLHHEENTLLEINFQNARCTHDTNMNRYITKKKSAGKIDLVISIQNALYMLYQERINGLGWVVQY